MRTLLRTRTFENPYQDELEEAEQDADAADEARAAREEDHFYNWRPKVSYSGSYNNCSCKGVHILYTKNLKRVFNPCRTLTEHLQNSYTRLWKIPVCKTDKYARGTRL